MVGGSRVDRDACLSAGDQARGRIRSGDALRPRRRERGTEGVHAGVCGRKRVVGRQGGLGVGAGEVDRAGVARGGVAVGVAGHDRDIARCPCDDRRREAGEHQATGSCRVDDDAGLRAGDGAGGRIGSGQRLAPGGFERDAKGMHAGIGRHESVIGRQGRLAIAAREMHRAGVAGGSVAVEILGLDRHGAGHSRAGG